MTDGNMIHEPRAAQEGILKALYLAKRIRVEAAHRCYVCAGKTSLGRGSETSHLDTCTDNPQGSLRGKNLR